MFSRDGRTRHAAEGASTPDRDHPRIFAVATILVGLSLFLPRPFNFAPVGALGLFSGAYAPRRSAWLYPLAALTVYVVAIGGYAWLVLASVYLGFAVPAVLGGLWLRGRARPLRVGAAAVVTSVCFFLISNLGSWVVFGIPRGETLLHHYLLGLPFFWNTLAGDLVFSAVLFGGYELAARKAGAPVAGGPAAGAANASGVTSHGVATDGVAAGGATAGAAISHRAVG